MNKDFELTKLEQETSYCHCGCHNDPNIKHCMACCHRCEYCGRNIAFFYEQHVEKCKKLHNGIKVKFLWQ